MPELSLGPRAASRKSNATAPAALRSSSLIRALILSGAPTSCTAAFCAFTASLSAPSASLRERRARLEPGRPLTLTRCVLNLQQIRSTMPRMVQQGISFIALTEIAD